jgi:hypothetical protein
MNQGDEKHTAAKVTLRGGGGRVLTRAGRWLGYLSIPWFFLCAFIEDLFRVGPWRSAPAWTLLGILAIAIAPAVTWAVVKIVGGRGALAVLVEAVQPRVTLDWEGLEVCQPSTGCHRFEWSDIGALEKVQRTGIRRALSAGDPPDGELKSLLGRSLVRLPASLMIANLPGWRRQVSSVASLAILLRPDLFVLTDETRLGTPIAFARREAARDDSSRFERAERRRRWLIRALIGGFAIVFVLTIVLMTSHGAPAIR